MSDIIQFYRAKILEFLELMRKDMGELRFKLYVDMVNSCTEIEDLKEMAELELQLDFIKYTKENIKDKLEERGTSIKEIKTKLELSQSNYLNNPIETDDLYREYGENLDGLDINGDNTELRNSLYEAIENSVELEEDITDTDKIEEIDSSIEIARQLSEIIGEEDEPEDEDTSDFDIISAFFSDNDEDEENEEIICTNEETKNDTCKNNVVSSVKNDNSTIDRLEDTVEGIKKGSNLGVNEKNRNYSKVRKVVQIEETEEEEEYDIASMLGSLIDDDEEEIEESKALEKSLNSILENVNSNKEEEYDIESLMASIFEEDEETEETEEQIDEDNIEKLMESMFEEEEDSTNSNITLKVEDEEEADIASLMADMFEEEDEEENIDELSDEELDIASMMSEMFEEEEDLEETNEDLDISSMFNDIFDGEDDEEENTKNTEDTEEEQADIASLFGDMFDEEDEEESTDMEENEDIDVSSMFEDMFSEDEEESEEEEEQTDIASLFGDMFDEEDEEEDNTNKVIKELKKENKPISNKETTVKNKPDQIKVFRDDSTQKMFSNLGVVRKQLGKQVDKLAISDEERKVRRQLKEIENQKKLLESQLLNKQGKQKKNFLQELLS